MAHRICAIAGDGIGREVVPAALLVLRGLLPGLTVVEAEAGFDCFTRRGEAVPAETLAAIASCEATLFGATASPSAPVPGYRSAIVTLRRHFHLFGCVRRARSVALPGARPDVDMLIVRENTECLYVGRETAYGDYAEATRLISSSASRRVARLACELARQSGRRRITIVHKANILPLTCGLFRDTARAVIAEYPELTVEEMLVDTAAMRMVTDPERFDVILTTNLFGDILSDIAAGLTGGLGLAASANIGEPGPAIFEPVHGAAPDIVGRGIANPLATLRTAALLLRHIGESAAAEALDQAVEDSIAGAVRTPDLGGSATTAEVTEAVLGHLQSHGFVDRVHPLSYPPVGRAEEQPVVVAATGGGL
ncbi:MAG TPA: isocitrate/isopropylmalate dehydrogenase family protein [Chloroflexota bacterium]|nr:isocitrate/isopropylmalate dehydrogenase family protein [Chloroflexota bacterium]